MQRLVCDWEIRCREHIGTNSTFLFYFQPQVLRDCRVDFLEQSERASVCEAVCLCEGIDAYFMPTRVWYRIVFLTCSVRAEWPYSKPECVWVSMHACSYSWRVVYFYCIIHLVLISTIYEKLIMAAAFIWVSIISDSSFVFLVRQSLHLCETLIMCIFLCTCMHVLHQVCCCDVRQVVCVEWQAGAERLPG